MPGIPSAMLVTSPGLIIPSKKGGTLPSNFFFLEDTAGRFISKKEHVELVIVCSVMVLMFADAYLADDNGWKAFSLTHQKKRGRDMTINF